MLEFSYEVVVIGGGPAGFAAAVASARQGAKTTLIERYGFCGGMATAGGVSVYMNEHAGTRNLASNIYNELIDGMIKDGAAYASTEIAKSVVANTEDIKKACDDMLVESGVDIYYHLTLEGAAFNNGTIESITATGRSNKKYKFASKVFIDATGDADLAFFAGLETEVGRPQDNQCQPMTQIYSVGPVDLEKARAGGCEVVDNKYVWWGDGDPNLLKYIKMAKDNNEWKIPKECFCLIWADPRCPWMVTVNGTRMVGYDATNSLEVTKAELEGRKQVADAVEFMRKYLPGFENVQLVKTSPQLGVRETRRVIGPYRLVEDDVVECRKFDDQIAKVAYYIDAHSPDSEGTDMRRLPEGECYGIPYRCLQSKDCRNYLVAGRAISASHIAASSARVMPVCMTTGEAAGVAAAMAARNESCVADVDIVKLKEIIEVDSK
ncbi:MAG: FAD-dependent oxidoreductase [Sedimentisphaeraceae bacterium JB056]